MTATKTDLDREGFEPITEWQVSPRGIKQARVAGSNLAGWLYAFVEAGEVRYVGMTSRVLSSRMDNYRDNPGDQNERLGDLIKADLEQGRRVEIYGRHEPEDRRRAVEEQRLITKWQPEWNRS